ncbi:MAG: MBL fold metallo-hydrolase [Acidobacteria bacterium]|nr:MBL fold metallo-hydrolase [Acidobacteriota bacterium]MCU0252988.1 MBL fold metallo-hydrolase [Acidobacteriota bacterium]
MQRRLIPIEGNTQRLDGGSMFGNAPRVVWERWIAPDEQHRIPLACRALLVSEPARNVLFETGVGVFFEPRLRERFAVQEDRHVLLDNLGRHGLTDHDIDVVVLSHLHFDHAGGLLAPWEPGRPLRLLFPRARIVVGRGAWERALEPHPRDRASFIPGLTALLQGSGRLELVEGDHSETLGTDYRFRRSDGHTPGLLVSEIATEDGPVVYPGDLIPGAAWVHLPITMGYDRFPELVIDEKRALLEDVVRRNGRLVFTHDPVVAAGRVRCDDAGRFSVEPVALEA